MNAVQPIEKKPTPATPPQKVQVERATTKPRRHSTSAVDEEMRMQNEMLRRKTEEAEVSPDRNINRFPVERPLFTKPEGPKQGGTMRVEHPKAAEGLIRINKDGSYQYRTQVKEKSQSSSVKLGMMSPPQIKGENSAVTFESMYGKQDIFEMEFDYEWQPFRKYGALGLKAGVGLATTTGKGFFKNQNRSDNRTRSEESYTLFIAPVSAFLEYRFEYVRRQWVVPYIMGGATYYGMSEMRNDGLSPTFAGAPAAGGGGGLMISLSRFDAASAFTLSQEYGIADMWLVLEARAMQGLSEDIDFTNQTISAGIAVDF
jgi:hypothetical protein